MDDSAPSRALSTDGSDRARRRHRSKFLCLTLPTEDDGFIVCGVARVRAEPHDAELTGDWYPAERRLLHELRANTGTDSLPPCP